MAEAVGNALDSIAVGVSVDVVTGCAVDNYVIG